MEIHQSRINGYNLLTLVSRSNEFKLSHDFSGAPGPIAVFNIWGQDNKHLFNLFSFADKDGGFAHMW